MSNNTGNQGMHACVRACMREQAVREGPQHVHHEMSWPYTPNLETDAFKRGRTSLVWF